MKKHILFLLFSLLLSLKSFSQDQNNSWDKNYTPINVLELLNEEKEYAKSVENDTTIPPYYYRVGKYRFEAKYLGEKRKLEKDIRNSMMNVYRLHIDTNLENLNKLLGNELLFEVEGQSIWMPIQIKLEGALDVELKKGDICLLYCLFLNEHTLNNILYNTFFISEFVKEE